MGTLFGPSYATQKGECFRFPRRGHVQDQPRLLGGSVLALTEPGSELLGA